MKTFTAKQFNRTPGVVFDAARDDGKCVITHGNNNEFMLSHSKSAPRGGASTPACLGDGAEWNKDEAHKQVRRKLVAAGLVPLSQLSNEEKEFLAKILNEKGYELKTKHDIDTALTGAMGKDAHLAARKIVFGDSND